MRQITIALKSSKAATLVALLAVGLYALTEFGSHPSQMAQAGLQLKPLAVSIPDAADEGKIALASIPTPNYRPVNLPYVAQPDQFTVISLQEGLNGISFNLDTIRLGARVPRYFIKELPVDILDVVDVKSRKEIFLSVMLPLILDVNGSILQDRSRLQSLKALIDMGQVLSMQQNQWIAALAKRYYGTPENLTDLLQRVDTIPVSLALAQSIEESGWGTSRFAREGNALYGQRVWSNGDGIIPEERAEGENYEVKAFEKLGQSVAGYARNLNRHEAYADFRFERARLKAENGAVSGYELSNALTAYSERGEDYTAALQALIRVNNLGQFEAIKLAPKQVAQIFNSANN
jgi:Bax protein